MFENCLQYYHMKKIVFNNQKCGKVLKILSESFTEISYSSFCSALRKKDILIDGKRIKQDEKLVGGEEIVAFIPDDNLRKLYSVFYEDENIVVVNKQKGIEVCDGENNVELDLKKNYNSVFAIHRIDKNTSGLVMFAKSQKVFDELSLNLKNGNIKKFYLAKVFGNPKQEEDLYAFLLKDAKNSFVKIYKQNVSGAVSIHTKYKLIEKCDDCCLLEVELFTGKTHQIRAHLASVGLPIVGDGKYGDNEKNKKLGKHKQCLVAYKLKFCLPQNSALSYLNDLQFEIKNPIL